MKKRYLALSILLVISVAFSGCHDSSGDHTNTQDNYSILISEENNGATLEIDISQEIVIALRSNPSTGYHWEHTNTDGTFIIQQGESFFTEDKRCRGAAGCGGIERLSFIASRTGTGAISLVYHRSFEGEPIDQFRVDVIVTDRK